MSVYKVLFPSMKNLLAGMAGHSATFRRMIHLAGPLVLHSDWLSWSQSITIEIQQVHNRMLVFVPA